jgi:uncharacterized protein (DUF486 family)
MPSSSAAHRQLERLVRWYGAHLPMWTFPALPLIIAAVFQSFAWMAGPIFLSGLSLVPRMLVLWIFAAGEYTFMSPAMNAGVEILGMREPQLVVLYQVITLVVFILVDVFIFQKEFKAKYLVAFALVALAVYVANM